MTETLPVAKLSTIVTPMPGDVIFTGHARRGRRPPDTAAVPAGRRRAGHLVHRIGELRHRFVAA